MSKLDVDLNLVRKYNVAGPRYTSYPPATRFSEHFKWVDLAEQLMDNNQSDRDLSLYFHIPFCESLCWYCGCTTLITTQHDNGKAYLNYLNKDLRQMASVLDPHRSVVQLHLGGGTPTFLAPDELRRLGEMIRKQFRVASNVEGGVEIDPRHLTREHLVALREAGFNRASIGVQDFDPKVQIAVHRYQPRDLTKRAIDWLDELGFESINIDLIYGLPYQTASSFARTLDTVLELQPDRLAVFSYAHVPWLKPAQKILQDSLPSAEDKLQLLKLVIERLTEDNEYIYVGMDHFARPHDELVLAQRNKALQRNFQGYSTRAGADIYAFGMSAISQIEKAYWQNTKDLPDYYAALDRGESPLVRGYILTEEDQIRRKTIMRLMCDLSLDFGRMSEEFGFNFREHFASELEKLAGFEADDLIHRTETGLEITSRGRLFLRNIAMCFDAYLPKENERRFSGTI
jgi:oxygen-independent coproporphyrinogen-3 oxidase